MITPGAILVPVIEQLGPPRDLHEGVRVVRHGVVVDQLDAIGLIGLSNREECTSLPSKRCRARQSSTNRQSHVESISSISARTFAESSRVVG